MSTNVIYGNVVTLGVTPGSISNGQKGSVGVDIEAIGAPRDDLAIAVQWTGGTQGQDNNVSILISSGLTAEFQTGEDEGRRLAVVEPILTNLPNYQTRVFSLAGVVGLLPAAITLWVDNNSASTISTVEMLYQTVSIEDAP